MHTYRQKPKDNSKWEVGYYTPESDGSADEWWLASKWHTVSEHDDEVSAMRRVNFLNGGG